MKEVKKILFPTDFSACANHAFTYTLLLADQIKATIEVVHIIFPESEAVEFPILVNSITESRIAAARESLKAFVENGLTRVMRQIKNIPNIQSDIEIGFPINVLNRVAERDHIDLIIMGTEGENSPIDKLFGSVAQGVVEKSSCPVLVVPNSYQFNGITSVAYASDLKESDPFEVWKLSQLLKPYAPILRMVHVNDGREELEYERMSDFKAFFHDNSPAIQTKYHHLPGKNVVEELNDFADTYDIDMLAMYQPNRSFFNRLFHKSQTRQMSAKCSVPLLIIKD